MQLVFVSDKLTAVMAFAIMVYPAYLVRATLAASNNMIIAKPMLDIEVTRNQRDAEFSAALNENPATFR